MSLRDNLLRPEFSRDREELLNYRLLYEIKKHGLASGVDYELFPPVIDKNGYDLLVKHGQNIKAFQLKTVAKSAKTSNWKINKKFLRPDNLKDGDLILRNFSADIAGLGGGVIVIEYDIDADSELQLQYYYFDYQVFYLFRKGLLKWRMNDTTYYNIVASLFVENSKPFKLQKSMLYKVEGIKDLLTISRIEPLRTGLTRENTGAWTFPIIPLSQNVVNKNIEIRGHTRVLEIKEMSSVQSELVVGDRTFKNYK